MYAAPDEQLSSQFVQNKDQILKVMFLCAVTRPRFDENGDCTFDGKIGLWPSFVEYTQARRASQYRPAGTPITRTISCDWPGYRRFLLCQFALPSKKEKCLTETGILVMQQDGWWSFRAHSWRWLWILPTCNPRRSLEHSTPYAAPEESRFECPWPKFLARTAIVAIEVGKVYWGID